MLNREGRAVRAMSWCAGLALSAGAFGAPPNVRHVASGAPAGGDGLSWATAFNSLQAAIAAASGSGGAIDELWVKEGTYAPGTAATTTFSIGGGLGVYGGFAGTEAVRDERDPAAHVTILDGNLGGTRAYRVVTMGAGVLSGVTVTGGLNVQNQFGNTGSGVFVNGSATIDRCVITGNKLFGKWEWMNPQPPGLGAGVFCATGSSLTMVDSVVTNNTGEIYISSATPGHLVHGAGLAGVSCAVRLVRCTFGGNTASTGVYQTCGGGSSTAPDGGHGGALYLQGSSVMIESCRIVGNTAGHGAWGATCGGGPGYGFGGTIGGSGGGLYLDASAAVLINSVVAANYAGNGGKGGAGASPASGGAGGKGGGMYVGAGSDLAIVNCTVANNGLGIGGEPGLPWPPFAVKGADGVGSGLYTDAVLSAANSIFWNDAASDIVVRSQATVRYCDVQGGYVGAGNINIAPMFVSVSNRDFHLAAGSPCIDAGSNLVDGDPTTPGVQPLPSLDADGSPRRVDDLGTPNTGAGSAPIVDMGAYEVQNPCEVDLNGDGIVDFGDYLEFLNLFDAGDLRVDFTGDGIVDFSDYLEFLNLFDAGC